MATEVLNMNGLIINELRYKLKDFCFKNRHKPYTWPLTNLKIPLAQIIPLHKIFSLNIILVLDWYIFPSTIHRTYPLYRFSNHIALRPGRSPVLIWRSVLYHCFRKTPVWKETNGSSKKESPSNFIEGLLNKKMPTQLEASAGIKFNFLTYARSKNNTTIKSFYFKVNLLHQHHLLCFNKRTCF